MCGKKRCFCLHPDRLWKIYVLYGNSGGLSCFDKSILLITPLKAIGEEQCGYLEGVGLSAVRLNDDKNIDKSVLDGAMVPNFIFSDPETILKEEWVTALRTTMSICNIVVDEAHTVKYW